MTGQPWVLERQPSDPASHAPRTPCDLADRWRRLVAAFNANDVDVIGDIVDERFVDHHLPADSPPGIEGLRTWWAVLHDAFDLRLDVDDVVVGADRLATRMTFRGIHLGPFRHQPATGKACLVTVMTIERFERGRLIERWQVGDELKMLEQLGILAMR